MKKLLLTGIGLVVLGVYAKNKVNQIKEIADTLSVKVDAIKLENATWDKITLRLNLLLKNNTKHSFSLDAGSLIKINNIAIYDKTNRIVANAKVDISNIELSPNGEMLIEDIVVDSTFLGVLTSFMQFPDAKDYFAVVSVEAFGQNWSVA